MKHEEIDAKLGDIVRINYNYTNQFVSYSKNTEAVGYVSKITAKSINLSRHNPNTDNPFHIDKRFYLDGVSKLDILVKAK